MLIDAQSLVAYAALGLGGRDWDFVKAHPRIDQVPLDALASVLHAKKRSQKADTATCVQEALGYLVGLERYQTLGGVVLGCEGPSQLGALCKVKSPPLLAFYRGAEAIWARSPKVAIVGTRKPSDKGLAQARDLSRALAAAGIVVVSGGAIGIDLAAHEAALLEGGQTLSVLGDPVNFERDERPFRVRNLAHDAGFASISLFGPWVKPAKGLFVTRNQYVAAISDAVVVVEGRLSSGTLHTANFATAMGTPVWAVPGAVDDVHKEACNQLLESGQARALFRLEVFLRALGKATPPQLPIPQQLPSQAPESTDPIVRQLRAQQGGMSLDDLAFSLNISASDVQSQLLMLELSGQIARRGAEFVLT